MQTQTSQNITERLDACAKAADQYLAAWLDTFAHTPQQLKDAIAYSLLGPGKRIRPALTILCAEAVGGTMAAALPAAGSLELIHCFSLVHDDLPAMDDDDLRRGRPTNHKVFGEATAILAGDAMHTLAFELLATRVSDARVTVRLVQELADATGPQGMIGGQVLDTCHPTEEKPFTNPAEGLTKLQTIHRMKTGALIKAACRMGAISAAADDATVQTVDQLGCAIGLAFQIVDDMLDVTASDAAMGKRTGKDAQAGKLTYPGLLGMDETRRHLAAQVAIAETMVARLGPAAAPLAQLVHYLADRGH